MYSAFAKDRASRHGRGWGGGGGGRGAKRSLAVLTVRCRLRVAFAKSRLPALIEPGPQGSEPLPLAAGPRGPPRYPPTLAALLRPCRLRQQVPLA